MRLHKKFITIALVVIFSLLIFAIPAAPVYAAESIELSDDSGEPGDTIYVEGDGFTNSDYIEVYFDGDYKDWRSVSGGSFTGSSFTVPDVAAGDYDVDVIGFDSGESPSGDEDTIIFTVTGVWEITLSPTSGPVGTDLRIKGYDFDDGRDIKVYFDGDDLDIDDGDEETNSGGDFTTYVIIPESEAGDHTITVDVNGDEAEADFEVEPEITIDPETGSPSTDIEITGSGFEGNSDITVYFDGDDVDIEDGDTDTDSDGSFVCTVIIPTGTEPGDYDIEVEDEGNNSATAEFSVAIDLTVSPTTGNVGTLVTVSGSGFAASSAITVTYDSTQVATTTSDSDGDFTATFNVPASVHGAHDITATGTNNSLSDVFTMESAAPIAPTPLTPETDEEVGSKPTLTWDGVTDPSGVTYSVQVSSDAAFVTLLVDETGLTTAEYILTDEQKLEQLENDAPYYWRVQAVDGASNESPWSTIETFYVKGGLFGDVSLPWPAIVGICAAGFIPLGIFIGRRMAYQYY